MSEQYVGLYGTFTSTQAVVNAVQNGWPGIGAVSGSGNISYSPYTVPYSYNNETVDQIVENAYKYASFWWLDFWTVSGPPNTTQTVDWNNAGKAAGKKAAQVIMSAANSGGFVPAYVIIDLEGSVTPTSADEFTAIVDGWVSGVNSVTSALTAAFYSDQYQWEDYKLDQLGIPGFVAVSPIQGNQPYVSGANIVGYIAYPGACVNGSASSDVNTIISWGKYLNTLQFSNSGDDCGPN